MSEYYDKEKFSGGTQPPKHQPQRNQNDWEWIKWPLIIILFSMGLWPLAIIAIAFFSNNKKRGRAKIKYSNRETEERVARALERAERQVAFAREQVEKKNTTTASDSKTAQQFNYEKDKSGKTVTVNGQTVAKKSAAKKDKDPGKALKIIGICLLVIGSIIAMDFAASSLQGYYTMLEDLFVGLWFMAGGGISLGWGAHLTKLSRRTKRYILAIGTADSMRIDEIAKRVNRTPAEAKKELQKLIEKGYLGDDAYIDHEKG